jgi:hypothetical protein
MLISMAITTLKVPSELRDRIATDARGERKTIAGFLEGLVDEYEHQRRLDAVGRSSSSPLPVTSSRSPGW